MKDYFYFTKTERNGISMLLIIIAALLLYPHIVQQFKEQKVYDFSSFAHQVAQNKQLSEEYAAAQKAFQKASESKPETKTIITLSPFTFDPNTLSPEGFSEMGLPDRVGRNIENYRRAGGSFRSREDLKRIFSITEEWYSQLENFIDLPTKDELAEQRQNRRAENEKEKVKEAKQPDKPRFTEIVIDINEADSLEWQKVRGIGTVFGRRITIYRERLGGFHSKSQLLEVFGMDSSRFEMIQNQISMQEGEPTKIDLNTADFTTLVHHPYLNGNLANSILQMRDRHGPYQSIEGIKQSHLISDSLFTKLAPYLEASEQLQP